jgi:S-adenosylmethionine:tRNA-ribosyltransferase-isomerase (queuine synthetase)
MYGGVLVTDALTGEDHELQYLSPYEAHKTLGHYKEPAGIQVTQYRKLLEKSNELTSFLWSNHLTREEAWTFYFSTYLPSISYPLANSHFTERQLTKIQKKAMNIMFAKCGYNRNTKRGIVWSSRIGRG